MMWWCTVAMATTGAGVQDLTWESPSQPVPVHDEAPIFTGPLVDTGWWPSSSDPLAVRFHITPTGTVYTDIDADSELAWPDPLWHRVVAIPESGLIDAEASLDIEAELQIDIFGLWTGVIDLWAENFEMDGRQTFDGLLLDGDPVREVDVDVRGASNEVVDFTYQVFPGLDVVASIDVAPEVELVVSDGEIVSQVGATEIVQDVADRWTAVPLEPTMPASLETTVQWSAIIDGVLNVVFIPTVELETFIGNFQLFAIPLDVGIVDVADRQDADGVATAHALPGMDALGSGFDFGDVLLGQERTLQVPVSNLGDLILEGTASIDGDAAFDVFPNSLVARSQETDGLSVTFTPSGTTAATADLVIVSNDPLQPVLRIPLTGLGYEEVEEPTDSTYTGTPTTDGTTDDPPDTPGISGEDAKAGAGCGCSGAGASGAPLVGFFLAVLGLRRRRIS